MNTQLAYLYVKKYLSWRNAKDNKCDPGLIVVVVLLQSKLGLNFNMPYKAFTIQESITEVYQNTNDDVLKHNGKQYLYAAYRKEINIQSIYNKLTSINVCKDNGYEIIHLILTVIYLDVKYESYIENILVSLIHVLQMSDLKTEALYILFSINPYSVEQKWIDEITKNQQTNGSLLCDNFEKYNDTQALHTSYALILYLSYSKFKNIQQKVKYAGVIFVIFIYVYVYLSLKQYKANLSDYTNNAII